MWLDISIAISCAVAGLACGWVINAIGFMDDADPNALVTLNDSTRVTDERLEQVAQGKISSVAGRLHDYATTMAMDVDAHQSRVQAVNNTLQNQADEGTTEAIYRAVDELIAANDSMQEKLRIAQERIQEQTRQLESAEQMAHTDGLTRIANRRAFDDHLDQQFDKGAQQAGTLAILDVDHFKQFNDTYGHRAGDEVLRTVASILNARLNPYGIAARFGGEEFAIVMDAITVENAAEIVDHARIAVGERDVHFGDKRLRITMSAGLAELLPSESKEDWLQRADDALYHSKADGRDCTHWMNVGTPVRVGKLKLTKDQPSNQATTDDQLSEAKVVTDAPSNDISPADEITPESDSNAKVDLETASAEVSSSAAVNSVDERLPQDETHIETADSEPLNIGSKQQQDASGSDASVVSVSNVDATPAPKLLEKQSKKANSIDASKPNELMPPNDVSATELGTPAQMQAADDSLNGDQGENFDNNKADRQSRTATEIQRSTRTNQDGSGPRAFNYLPDAEALAEAMADLHQRSQSASIPLHVMAIRFDRDAGKSTTRALLQIVRATLRSVDRIGCDDECTLLVCMPNLSSDSAFERAQQICHSAETLSDEDTDGEEPCHVSIGLADAANDSNFAHVVSRVKLAADTARADGTNIQFAE